MLRNSGGLSLLRGRLGLQVVVDDHTIDDSLRRKRWDRTKRSMRGQDFAAAILGPQEVVLT